jgi:hypothetical protein
VKTVPVRTDDGCWNPELAGERPPRFGEELLGLATWSASVPIIVNPVLRPNGVAVAVGALGLQEAAVVVELVSNRTLTLIEREDDTRS